MPDHIDDEPVVIVSREGAPSAGTRGPPGRIDTPRRPSGPPAYSTREVSVATMVPRVDTAVSRNR